MREFLVASRICLLHGAGTLIEKLDKRTDSGAWILRLETKRGEVAHHDLSEFVHS
jgi:hypothetical protein